MLYPLNKAYINYKIFNHLISPRPILWASSTSSDGVLNIAPFSFINVISIKPAIISMSFLLRSDGGSKKTYENIKASKKASLCLVDRAHTKLLEASAKEMDKAIAKVEKLGLHMQVLEASYPPVPKLAPPNEIKAALFCELERELVFGSSSKCLLLEVKSAYVADDIEDFDILPLGRYASSFIDYKPL